LDNCPDKSELEKYRNAYEKAGEIIKIEQSEKDEQEALRKRIAGEDSKTPPTPKISEAQLKEVFGDVDGVVNASLATK
jgi:hypothetical protein